MGSVQDDNRTKFLEALGLSSSPLSNSDLERLVLLDETATAAPGTGRTNTDLRVLGKHPRLSTYTFPDFDTPKFVPGLAAYYRADKISGVEIVRDSFTRATNLCSNPSFEGDTTSWAVQGAGVALSRDITTSKIGVASGKWVCDGLVANQGLGSPIADTSVDYAAKTVTISFYVKTNTSGDYIFQFIERNSSNGILKIDSVTVALVANADWKYFTYTKTLSNNAPRFNTKLVTTGSLATTIWLDAAQYELGSKATQYSSSTELGVSETGQVWSALAGSWGVRDGKADLLNNTSQAVAVVNAGSSDGVISATLTPKSGAQNDSGLTVRVSDNDNYYLCVFLFREKDLLVNIWKKVAGAFTSLNNISLTDMNWNITSINAEFRVSGSTLEGWVNGKRVVNTTDTSLTAGTSFGIRNHFSPSTTNFARFDDFSVKTLSQADGAPVAFWPDLSGNNRHATQADAAKRPLLRTQNRNLLTYNQATVEDGTTGGWVAAGAATLSTASGTGYVGTYALTVTLPTTDVVGSVGAKSSPDVPVAVGQVYTISAWVNVPAATPVVQMFVNIRDQFGLSNTKTTVKDSWHRIVSTVTVPAGSSNGIQILFLNDAATTAGQVFYIDAVQVEQANTATEWTPPVTIPNTRPVVQFDGSTDTMTGPYGVTALPMTVYVVQQPDRAQGDVASDSVLTFSKATSDVGLTVERQASTAGIWAGAGLDTATTGTTTPIVISAIYNGTTSSVGINGGTRKSGDSGLSIPDGLKLTMAAISTGRFMPGNLGAVLVYEGGHDDATRKKIEKWLGNRFGIAVAG